MASLTQQLVLKEGNVFVLTNETGDITGNTGQGLYYRDTRYLSVMSFRVNGQSPPLLDESSSQNFMGTLQFANDIFQLHDVRLVLPQTLSIRRSRFISGGLHERIGFANYNRFPVPVTVTLQFGSDFRDIFDVRGFHRESWGELLAPLWEDGTLVLRYSGMDGVERRTNIAFDRSPDGVDMNVPADTRPSAEPGIMLPVVGAPSYHILFDPPTATLTWHFTLEPHAPVHISLHVIPHIADEEATFPGELTFGEVEQLSPSLSTQAINSDGRFDKAVNYMRFSYWTWETQSSRFSTDSEEFSALLKRSQIDLRVLSAPDGDAYFPSAGIPWYTCPFGRDSIITALQALALNPLIAVGTLRVLARHQGSREDPWREEQPGKILHELRMGEMARLNLVPHTPYYGSVDATPLFVLLFTETMCWLDDDNLYEEMMPHVWKAIEWIDKYGDVDGDGFVEYTASTNRGGIRNQVWKDSEDSIQFPDGSWAETPLAAVEVQAYVYAAKRGLSELLRRKGDIAAADKLASQAARLKKRFNKAFWVPDLGFFSQGLDVAKQPVPTISSNPGHCLWCGIVDDQKAEAIVARMMQSDMLSGWGIRTISDQSPSYNPMSYHNGSIWPHDNSLIIAGFKRYGFHDEANAVVTQIVEAARHFQYARLPELYCGFSRDKVYHSGPAEYPVSCSPQAWAAGASILMVQAILGLQTDAHEMRIRINPRLPEWLETVQVANLRIGQKRVDVVVNRRDGRDEVFLAGGETGVTLEIG